MAIVHGCSRRLQSQDPLLLCLQVTLLPCATGIAFRCQGQRLQSSFLLLRQDRGESGMVVYTMLALWPPA